MVSTSQSITPVSTSLLTPTAAVRCCVCICTTTSRVSVSSPQLIAALANDGIALNNGKHLCGSHRQRAIRLIAAAAAATTAAIVTATAPVCCYCTQHIINERPCRPVIDTVKLAAHARCYDKEKRKSATAAATAASVVAAAAAMDVADAVAVDGAKRRYASLRSSGKNAISIAARVLEKHEELLQ